MAKLTTIGLYNYDNSLFDNLTFPEGIDKDLAVNEILMRSGEFEVTYPNPEFFKTQIDFWGRKHYRTFEKWVQGLAEEFNPLYNYDRYEEYADTEKKTGKSSRSNSSEATTNSSDNVDFTSDNTETGKTENTQHTDRDDTINTSATDENKVSAYNSSSYQGKEKTDHTGEEHGTHLESITGEQDMSSSGHTANNTNATGSQRTTGTSSDDASNNEDRTLNHSAHLYGNIGVTTSAALLAEFLKVQEWNIYEHIADLFVEEFCIMVY